MLDSLYAYKFVRLLTQDWKDMPAYELGIIDEDGEPLKKRRELRTKEEKEAYSKFHTLVFNIRRMLEKIPFGKSTIARYAAAVKLLQEEVDPFVEDKHLIENIFIKHLGEEIDLYEMIDENMTILENTTAGIEMGGNKIGKQGGCAVFDCDMERLMKSRFSKPKYHKYKNYVGDDELGEQIRVYARKNPKVPIMLRDSKTGTMLYLRK